MKTILALAAAVVFALPVAAQDNCRTSVKPPKPFTPAGCIDTTPTCLCAGTLCRWIWACIPRGLPSMTAPTSLPSGLPSGIDPTIPLQVRPPQVPDLMDTYRKALEIRNLQLQEQALQALRQQDQQMTAAPADIHPSIPVLLPEGKTAPTLLRPGEGVPIPPAASQSASPSMYGAAGHLNCRWWVMARAAAPAPLNELYLLALQQGIIRGAAAAAVAATGSSPGAEKAFNQTADQYLPSGNFSRAETAKGIDIFCAAPENLPLEIVEALRVVVMRFNGSEGVEIEKELARLRREAAAPSERPR